MDSLGTGTGFQDWTVSEPESESKKLEPGISDGMIHFLLSIGVKATSIEASDWLVSQNSQHCVINRF